MKQNRALPDRFHLEVIQERTCEFAEELFTAGAAIHDGAEGDFTGPEGARDIAVTNNEYLPNGIVFVHDNHAAGGNLVTFRWTMPGVTVDSDEAVLEGLDLLRIENGKIAKLWVEYRTVNGQ